MCNKVYLEEREEGFCSLKKRLKFLFEIQSLASPLLKKPELDFTYGARVPRHYVICRWYFHGGICSAVILQSHSKDIGFTLQTTENQLSTQDINIIRCTAVQNN